MSPISRRLAALALLAALPLAACSHGAPSPGASRAKASISALATSPAVVAAEKKAIGQVEACAKSAEGLTVVIPAPGSSASPSVSGASYHVLAHPVKAVKAIVACTPAGKNHGRTVLKCAENVVASNGIGHGVLAKDLADAATKCVAAKS